MKKISKYINQFLFPFLCGYRKGFTTRTVLVLLIDVGKFWKSNEIKRLGVRIDKKRKFDSYHRDICFKANKKLSVLSRLVSLFTFDRKRILSKAFFESNFKYFPLIWMFCRGRANNRIDKLYEQASRQTCIWWLQNIVLGPTRNRWFIYCPSYKYSNALAWNV